jgi:hypothetical protein
MYVDGGFHSDKVHETAKENEIKIHLTNMTGLEPSKKLPVTEFEIDEKTNVIKKCPNGNIPYRVGIGGGQTSAHFSHETCCNCELKEKCFSKKQVKDCVVRIYLKAVDSSREREKIKLNRKEATSKRAGIEGSNSALKRTGLNKLDVRGKAKSTVICGLKVTVQNIKRLIKYFQGGYKPKTTSKPINGILAPIFS